MTGAAGGLGRALARELVARGCRVFLPQLLETRGQILNVSSCFAWVGYPRKTAYAASKGAMRAFSQCLRMELAGSGVAVTELYPGPLATAIVRRGGVDSEEMRAREEAFLARRGATVSDTSGGFEIIDAGAA